MSEMKKEGIYTNGYRDNLYNICTIKTYSVGGGVLGDGLGSLGDGVLGELTWKEESDSSLDLSG